MFEEQSHQTGGIETDKTGPNRQFLKEKLQIYNLKMELTYKKVPKQDWTQKSKRL